MPERHVFLVEQPWVGCVVMSKSARGGAGVGTAIQRKLYDCMILHVIYNLPFDNRDESKTSF